MKGETSPLKTKEYFKLRKGIFHEETVFRDVIEYQKYGFNPQQTETKNSFCNSNLTLI